MADLVGVLDGAQVERCALIGTGDSGTYAIAAAAMIPERITSLMLHASTPRYMDDPGSGWVHGLNEEGDARG